jgi:hypothetical protein
MVRLAGEESVDFAIATTDCDFLRIVDISRLSSYVPRELIGRSAETTLLDNAWAKVQKRQTSRSHVITFVALGGEGKTSLVAHWAAVLASRNWAGCESAFAWSFFSQGSSNQRADSADLFLDEALAFFGEPGLASSGLGAFDKGRRLASFISKRRILLILDGLEPLQYPPNSPLAGTLKDQGITALLKTLASDNLGLCVVTTRYAIPELSAFLGKTVVEKELIRLSTEAGVELLKKLGVKGSLRKRVAADGNIAPTPPWNEFEQLVEDVKGHVSRNCIPMGT